MRPQIQYGKGSGYLVEVTLEQHMLVDAVSSPELEHASDEFGTAFAWDSTELNLVAGETMLFVKNIGEDKLHMDRVVIVGSNVICTWDVGIGSATTTPAGTTVTGVNMNQTFSSKTAEVTALSDETAVADATVMFRVKTAVSGMFVLDLSGVILGQDHYIQINQETESTSGSVILVGHFES